MPLIAASFSVCRATIEFHFIQPQYAFLRHTPAAVSFFADEYLHTVPVDRAVRTLDGFGGLEQHITQGHADDAQALVAHPLQQALIELMPALSRLIVVADHLEAGHAIPILCG